MWIFYPPVVLYIFWKGLRHKHLAWFTATNPGMPLSGLVLESKQQILTALKPAGEVIPPFAVISKALKAEDQLIAFKQALTKQDLHYPVILKPDLGERGLGVAVIRSDEEAHAYFSVSRDDIILQEYIEGLEFGGFYYRFPEEESGHIFAITDKRFTTVTGDGSAAWNS